MHAVHEATPDWHKLEPLRPAAERLYVERPAAVDIANWLRDGRSVFLVGPVGVGKSTELDHARTLLGNEHRTGAINVDRVATTNPLTSNLVLSHVAQCFADDEAPYARAVLDRVQRGDPAAQSELSDLLIRVSRSATTGRRKPVAFIDGLEKRGSQTQLFEELLAAFERYEDHLSFAVVAPFHAAYSPVGARFLAGSARLTVVAPIQVDGVNADAASGQAFMRGVLERRVGAALLASAPSSFNACLALSIRFSGGIVRTFLQLVADAAAHARLSRSDSWPTVDDINRAVGEQRTSIRRLLQPGDEKAIRAARGTDGREIELERKLRLLSHGILLERTANSGPVITIHPIAEELFTKHA